MTDVEYALTQERLRFIAYVVATMDLDGFLERINHAETLGPVLNPTLYIRGSKKLDAVRRIAEVARELQKAAKAVKE